MGKTPAGISGLEKALPTSRPCPRACWGWVAQWPPSHNAQLHHEEEAPPDTPLCWLKLPPGLLRTVSAGELLAQGAPSPVLSTSYHVAHLLYNHITVSSLLPGAGVTDPSLQSTPYIPPPPPIFSLAPNPLTPSPVLMPCLLPSSFPWLSTQSGGELTLAVCPWASCLTSLRLGFLTEQFSLMTS